MPWGLASLQTATGHTVQLHSSASGRRRPLSTSCMQLQDAYGAALMGSWNQRPALEGPRWESGAVPRPALQRAKGGPRLGLASSWAKRVGARWLLGLTGRPPATPPSSAQHFLTLGAGTGDRATLGLVLPIPGK